VRPDAPGAARASSGDPSDGEDDSDDDEYQDVGAAALRASEPAQPNRLAGMSDAEYLRSRVRPLVEEDDEKDDEEGALTDEAEAAEENDRENNEATEEGGAQAVSDHAEVDAADGEEADAAATGRLFVRNLPFTTTEEELGALFSAHGSVESVHVLTDRATARSKGLAYVQFAAADDAAAARGALDGSVFQGRLLHLYYRI
jgi:multiple RNA-binding domain-containing protein 1